MWGPATWNCWWCAIKRPRDNKGRGNLKAKIEETAGLPLYHHFEIQMIDTEEAKSNPIYRTAIREGVKL